MAIIGYPDDLLANHQLGARLVTAIDYLKTRAADDAAGLGAGETRRQEVAEGVWAQIQAYQTRPDAQFEGHRQCIDVQCLLQGREIIKLTALRSAKPLEDYDVQRDLAMYYARTWSSLRLEAGMVAILFPEDLHAPGISITEAESVVKVVVKVSV
ncbi:MAG: hypothetical protein BWY87_00005 [Deltaproteobacteria bacterium ADurb.Bin510]|nr:MAG: hypothetical protein BWY87_00005 [Deltaproteobacteria bacterium ADurb.Bin510]